MSQLATADIWRLIMYRTLVAPYERLWSGGNFARPLPIPCTAFAALLPEEDQSPVLVGAVPKVPWWWDSEMERWTADMMNDPYWNRILPAVLEMFPPIEGYEDPMLGS